MEKLHSTKKRWTWILCIFHCSSSYTRYAVPNEIKELDKQRRPQRFDEEATKFMAKYVNKKPIVTDIPEEPAKNESSEDEQGHAKDPRKDVGMDGCI